MRVSKNKAMIDIIRDVEQEYLRTDLPNFRAGDTITLYYKISEGGKERVQPFQGVVLQRSGSGINETFTIRKISSGIGVERIIPVNSPNIDRIDVNRRGKVRRARIFYLRTKRGKQARIKERRFQPKAK